MGRAWLDGLCHNTCSRRDDSSWSHSASSRHSRIGSLTVKGLALVIGLLFWLLVESIVRTALYCIDVFIVSLRSVELPNVHRLNSIVCLLSGQLLSHVSSNTNSELFVMEGSVKESLEYVLGKHGSRRCCFTLSGTVSVNFDSCSSSVSCHCISATWSSCTFLVHLGDMSRAIDAACSTTDLGLNHCVTACQA